MSGKIHGPRPTGIDPKVFEKNMMQVGRQRESVSKKEMDRLAEAGKEMDAGPALETPDRVDITRAGEKAAAQTGLLSDHSPSAEKKRVSAARTAAAQEAAPQAAPADAQPAPAGPGAPAAQGTIPQADPTGAQAAPFGAGAPAGMGAPTSATDAASRAKATQDDLLGAQQIYMQMAADRQKWFMEIWKILQDTQTKINEILQSAAAYRAQVGSVAAENWDKMIRDET